MVEMISMKQAEKITDMKKKDIENLARHGLIPCTKIGQEYLFTAQSLVHWKEKYEKQMKEESTRYRDNVRKEAD